MTTRSDDTGAVARQLGAWVVRLPNNLGYGGAVQTGFRYGASGGYDYAVMMDADGQHDPDLCACPPGPRAAGQCDVVVGSRFTGEMTYHASAVRRLGMRLFAGITVHSPVVPSPTPPPASRP